MPGGSMGRTQFERSTLLGSPPSKMEGADLRVYCLLRRQPNREAATAATQNTRAKGAQCWHPPKDANERERGDLSNLPNRGAHTHERQPPHLSAPRYDQKLWIVEPVTPAAYLPA